MMYVNKHVAHWYRFRGFIEKKLLSVHVHSRAMRVSRLRTRTLYPKLCNSDFFFFLFEKELTYFSQLSSVSGEILTIEFSRRRVKVTSSDQRSSMWRDVKCLGRKSNTFHADQLKPPGAEFYLTT